MSQSEWIALLEAFLENRLSAEAFERRFLEAWRAQRDAVVEPFPPAIDTLFYVVEAFSTEQTNRNSYDADETELRQAARTALRELREAAGAQTAAPTRTYDRARAREDVRRFSIEVRRIAGFGCVIALAWLAVTVLQIYYVSEFIQRELHWGAWPSSIVGFVLAFVPVVGNVLAFFGATGAANPWPAWLAALVFFAAPALALFSGWRRFSAWRR
ncbi:MAG: hypothetical protein JNJ73_04885 [Hyphomonadaceae bacterium]|nr:hypothetical protein [Hyphomonadaceae bacterium]